MEGRLFPADSSQLYLTLTIAPGSVPEPPITSEHFLRSYLDIGV